MESGNLVRDDIPFCSLNERLQRSNEIKKSQIGTSFLPPKGKRIKLDP
jgi:hypothetical protein